MSVEQQVKAGLRAVRDFLAGRSGDDQVAATDHEATREVVAAELLAKMSNRPTEETASSEAEGPPSGTSLEIPRHEEDPANKTKLTAYSQASNEEQQEQKRARDLFLEHGYFDETVQTLRTSQHPAQRAAAARALGVVGSDRGTAHLVAATFDDDPEVRDAATQALNQMNASTMATGAVRQTLRDEIKETPGTDSAKSELPQEQGQEVSGTSEVSETMFISGPAAQLDHPAKSAVADSVVASSDLMALDSANPGFAPTFEEEQLLLEEHRLRRSLEQLALQLFETTAARKQSEQEVQSRTEREITLRAEAAARHAEEERLRKQADEESERHRIEEHRALMVEQVARARAESEVQHLAEVETSLRLQAVDLRLAVAEFVRRRVASETARNEAAEASRLTEANRAHEEAKMRHDAELARLQSEESHLQETTDNLALRRAEVELERQKADAEVERLAEARARMRAMAEAGVQAEAERARLEAEIKQRTETALRLLEETRRRGREEQEHLEEEYRREVEAQQRRLAELGLMKTRAEAESRQLAEKEQQILSQVNSLQFADSQTRKRIEDAEARKHASEDAYRLAAEKVQRVEAEAHARAKEEEQMLARLEAERRTVAAEAQSRAAQEMRIREEIEMFRRLEEQERPRLEAAILQRAQAEARLRRAREHVIGETEANDSGENIPGHSRSFAAEQTGANTWQESRSETWSSLAASVGEESSRHSTATATADTDKNGMVADYGDGVDDILTSPVPPSILAYLNSVDPYKRAAAVSELARSHTPDAFNLIVNCFDDHSTHVRNAAARAFHKLEPNGSVEMFNRALEGATEERRRNIGAAIATSGLASEAINNIVGENREETYNALAILFVMAKTGEVGPLLHALQEHPDDEVGQAVTRLLTLSGHG